MKINSAKSSGFCPGVKRAHLFLEKLISEKRFDRIFTLGEIIHNRLYNENLKERNVYPISITELEAILNKTEEKIALIVRTHGITRQDSEILSRLSSEHDGLEVFDMTCHHVKAAQKIASENTSDSTLFLLFSDPNHPEAIATMSYANGEKLAFSSLSEIESLEIKDKTPILCSQTTQNSKEFKKIKFFLKNLCTNAIFFDTICNVTEMRQSEAVEIAKTSDAMIVVGGKESSNTRKLYDLCKQNCPETIWIESASQLPLDFASDAKSVGITAGASTPDGIILEVHKTMEVKNDFMSMLEDSLKTLHTGETVIGTVVTIGKNEIKLDLGTKFTGVLEKEQITDDPTADLSEMFKVGDEFEVFVIRVEDGKGIATVSKKRVDADNSWVVLKDAYDNGEVLEGKIVSANKGGVTLSTGANTVFVPASQTGIARGGDLSALVGTTQKVRLLEFDTVKKKAIGSIKVILKEEKKAADEALWATLEVGNHYTGTVKNITSYGAFVDIGGFDGMVHVSDLHWNASKRPSQIVSVGQSVEVFIKALDHEKKKISLGYITDATNTWLQFTQKFSVGQVVSAEISSIKPFGAFAKVYEDVEGLIHISRISTERINSPADVLKVGDVVDVKITEIDEENKKVALSIRALQEEAQRAAAAEARAAEKAAAEAAAAEEAKRLAEERADMAPYIVGSI